MKDATVTLAVNDLSMDHGAEDILRGLSRVDGFNSADISVDDKQVVVQYDGDVADVAQFKQVIEEIGFTVSEV